MGKALKVLVFDFCCGFMDILGLSFSTLLTALSVGCLRGVVVREASPLICLEMVDISAYRLVLLRREFWPSTISELVQSMKGFISESSS